MSAKVRRDDRSRLIAQVEQRFAAEGTDVDYVFACDGLVCIWDPVSRTSAPELIDRDSEGEVILFFLKERGRSFSSMTEAEAHYAGFAAR